MNDSKKRRKAFLFLHMVNELIISIYVLKSKKHRIQSQRKAFIFQAEREIECKKIHIENETVCLPQYLSQLVIVVVVVVGGLLA